MKKIVRSVTRTVFNLAGFDVAVTVLVPRDRNPIKIYEQKGEEFDSVELSLYLDFPSFITITLPKNDMTKDIPYQKLKFAFGPRWKKAFELFLGEFIKTFERDDIYYLEQGKLKMFMDLPTDINKVFKIGENVIELRPTIVQDYGGNMYEGCRFILNKEGIEGELTYQELISLKDSLEAIDLFIYSQALLLYVKGLSKERN